MAGRELQGGYTPEGLADWAEHRERQRKSFAEGGMLHLLDKSFNSQTLTSEDEKNVKDWDKMEREKERKKNKKEKRRRREDAERELKQREQEEKEKKRRKRDAKKRESEERIRKAKIKVFKAKFELDESLRFGEARAQAALVELDSDNEADGVALSELFVSDNKIQAAVGARSRARFYGDDWVSNPDDVPSGNPIENDGMAAAVVWNDAGNGRGRRGMQLFGNRQVEVLRPRPSLARQDEARSAVGSGEANIWGPDEEEDDNLLAQACLLPERPSGE